MAIIKTRKGEEIIVDDSDYEWLSKFKWHVELGYAVRTSYVNGKCRIRMHREIMNTPDGYFTDHINGNRLDNRWCNLRICTSSENARNRKVSSNNAAGAHGAHKRVGGKRFRSCIRVDGIRIDLGSFATAEEAHQAYIAASLEHHGAFSPYATGRQR